MPVRKCPVCRASVKLENFDRHFGSVHPGTPLPPALLEEARANARVARATSSHQPALRRSTLAAIGLMVALIVGLGLAAAYLPRSNTTPMHIHPQLAITIDGANWEVPQGIGIETTLWRDHTLDQYGMEGMSPLHTHDASGRIHVESRVTRDYNLGELFLVWGQSFDATQVLGHPAGPGHRVRMIVDGTEMAPTYGLVLKDGMTVHIICDVG